MAASNTSAPARKQVSIPPVVYVIGIVLVLGVAGLLYLERASNRPEAPPAPLTGPAKEYAKHLKFVSADGKSAESPKMVAHESYVKQAIVEITGNLQNGGDRIVDQIDLTCVFYDPYGQVVLRTRVPIVTHKAGKFMPGETRQFRMAFDNVPESWNQAMPQMVIARIEFT